MDNSKLKEKKETSMTHAGMSYDVPIKKNAKYNNTPMKKIGYSKIEPIFEHEEEIKEDIEIIRQKLFNEN